MARTRGAQVYRQCFLVGVYRLYVCHVYVRCVQIQAMDSFGLVGFSLCVHIMYIELKSRLNLLILTVVLIPPTTHYNRRPPRQSCSSPSPTVSREGQSGAVLAGQFEAMLGEGGGVGGAVCLSSFSLYCLVLYPPLPLSASASNSPPAAVPFPPTTATEGQAFLLALQQSFYDPDDDPLSFQIIGLPVRPSCLHTLSKARSVAFKSSYYPTPPFAYAYACTRDCRREVGWCWFLTVVCCMEPRAKRSVVPMQV